MPRARSPRLARRVAQLPVAFYRLVPGWETLFGKRWMLMTTTGRRSGKPRSVLLDVVGHDPASGRYYVQPGRREADWVRNVIAHPFVRVQIARTHFDAQVIDVSGPEGAEHVFAFSQKHRLQSRLVEWLMPDVKPPMGSEAQVKRWLAAHVLVFALAPTLDVTRPGHA